MLKIHRYVIHELQKEARKVDTNLIISEHSADHDDLSGILVDEVHETYNRDSYLKNTIFQDRNDNTFKKKLSSYLDDSTDDNFYSFSVDSLKSLERAIKSEPFAVGGFYLYVDYTIESNRFIAVILLRKKDGLNLKWVNGMYVVDPTENLNIDRIAMGFRLNYNIYSSAGDDRNYIGLITNQKDTVSKYFQEWVAAAGLVSNDKNTSSLVTIIKNIPLPTDDNGNDLLDRDSFKKEVYDFIDSHPKKIVNLNNLSVHFFGEDRPSHIFDYAQSEGIIIDNEFKRSSVPLKRLITIRAKVKGIELNVDFDKLNSNEVDVKEKMVIIRNPAIIDQINKERDRANGQ